MSEPLSEIGRLLFEQAHAMNLQFMAGLKVGRSINAAGHRALKECYANAQKDPQAKIPTSLSLAIEEVLRLREEQATNDYANDRIKRDKERPEWERDHSGRYDMGLKPGS